MDRGIWWIPQFMLSPAGRLYFLRLVLSLSVMMTGFAISAFVDKPKELSWILGLVLTISTSIHHLATAFGAISEAIAWIDITLTLVEFTCFLVTISFFVARVNRVRRNSYGAVGISLLVLLILKLLYLVSWKKVRKIRADNGEKTPTRMYERVDVGEEPSNGLSKRGSWWKYPARVLFGTTIWSENVPGEAPWVVGLRGFLVAVSICTLLAFGVYQAIIAPISELGMIPYKQFRAASLPQGFTSLNKGSWNLMVARICLFQAGLSQDLISRQVFNSWQHPLAVTHLSQAVTVQLQVPTSPSCHIANATVMALQARLQKNQSSEVVVVTCPENTPLPDVSLVVNFTGLVGNTLRWSWNVVSVYVGLTEDPDNVFANTQPIFLFQGTHMIAVTDVQFRQQLKPPELGTLGFETMETFLISTVKQIMPVSVASGPNISTLRFAPDDFTQEWTVVQDYRSKTVLEGLSSVGGLGSFLSTILVLLLGSSLMRAMLRSKPYSPFGLLHNVQSQQKVMAAKFNFMYKKLEPEMKKEAKDRGVAAFLCDTLVDMDALRYKEHKLSHKQRKAEPPTGDHGQCSSLGLARNA
ncbi:hypothetical protein NMY22_g16067 [Coprinellus aureogranulatus]|nr:hypothetical protein NMY22_g16067 [Coprinellus aureogranulatus]